MPVKRAGNRFEDPPFSGHCLFCALAAVPDDEAFRSASFYRIFSALLFLYITAALTVSVLGGLIDFFQYDILSFAKIYFSPEDSFKIDAVMVV